MPETLMCVATGAKATWREPDELRITLTNGEEFVIPRNEVLTVHGFCDSYMRYNGAFDWRGREVVYPHTTKP